MTEREAKEMWRVKGLARDRPSELRGAIGSPTNTSNLRGEDADSR